MKYLQDYTFTHDCIHHDTFNIDPLPKKHDYWQRIGPAYGVTIGMGEEPEPTMTVYVSSDMNSDEVNRVLTRIGIPKDGVLESKCCFWKDIDDAMRILAVKLNKLDSTFRELKMRYDVLNDVKDALSDIYGIVKHDLHSRVQWWLMEMEIVNKCESDVVDWVHHTNATILHQRHVFISDIYIQHSLDQPNAHSCVLLRHNIEKYDIDNSAEFISDAVSAINKLDLKYGDVISRLKDLMLLKVVEE